MIRWKSALGNTDAGDIAYSEHSSGYTGKGVMLGSTKLNSYAAAPAKAGEYTFVFKNGTINSATTGYSSSTIWKDTSVYMLVPGNSDVVFENMTFNGRGELRYPDVHLSVELSALHHLQELHLQRYRRGLLPGGEATLTAAPSTTTPMRSMPITPTPSGGVQAPATGVPAQMRVSTP